MADLARSGLWVMRAIYVTFCLLVILAHLLPLETLPRGWAPPDYLIAFTFAWALRRPDYVPILAIAGVFLLADLLFQRPPGLLAALVVLGTEYLRIRFAGLRDASFAGEWIAVCVMIAAITLANRLILSVVASTLPPLAPSVIQMVLTMAFYPFAVLLSQSLLGVRKPDPRQAETLGARA